MQGEKEGAVPLLCLLLLTASFSPLHLLEHAALCERKKS